MFEPDWPERDADMALILRTHVLLQVAAEAASPAEAAEARVEVEGLMSGDAAATRRHNAAQKLAIAQRLIDGSHHTH